MDIAKAEFAAVEQTVLDVEVVQLADLELAIIAGGAGDVAF